MRVGFGQTHDGGLVFFLLLILLILFATLIGDIEVIDEQT